MTVKSIIPIDDHQQRGVERLPAQYPRAGDFPNAFTSGTFSGWAGTLYSLLAPAQDMEDVLNEMLAKRGLQNAEGVNLDRLGEIVGASRDGLPDDEYLIIIIAQIAANNSDTVAKNLLNIATLLLGDDLQAVTISEVFPAKAKIDYFSEITFTVDSNNNTFSVQEDDGVSPVIPVTMPEGDFTPYQLTTILSDLVTIALGAFLPVSFTADRKYQISLDLMGLTNPSIDWGPTQTGPLFGFAVDETITGSSTGDPVDGPDVDTEAIKTALNASKAAGVELSLQAATIGTSFGFTTDADANGYGTLVGGLVVGGGNYSTLIP